MNITSFCHSLFSMTSRTSQFPPEYSYSRPIIYGDPASFACLNPIRPCVEINTKTVVQHGNLAETEDSIEFGIKMYSNGGYDCGSFDHYSLTNGVRYYSIGIRIIGRFDKNEIVEGVFHDGWQYNGTFDKGHFHGQGTLNAHYGVLDGQFNHGLLDKGLISMNIAYPPNYISSESGTFSGKDNYHLRLDQREIGIRTYFDGRVEMGQFLNGILQKGTLHIGHGFDPITVSNRDYSILERYGSRALAINRTISLFFGTHNSECDTLFEEAFTPFRLNSTKLSYFYTLTDMLPHLAHSLSKRYQMDINNRSPSGKLIVRNLLNASDTESEPPLSLSKSDLNLIDMGLACLPYQSKIDALYYMATLMPINPASSFKMLHELLLKDPSVFVGLRTMSRFEWMNRDYSVSSTIGQIGYATFFHSSGHYLKDSGFLPDTDFSLHINGLSQSSPLNTYITDLDQYHSLFRAFYGDPIIPPNHMIPFGRHDFHGAMFRVPAPFVQSFSISNAPEHYHYVKPTIFFKVQNDIDHNQLVFLNSWTTCARSVLSPIFQTRASYQPSIFNWISSFLR